ncbi:MAG: redoxin domain-containing protein, partial [bacterium]
MRCSKVLSLGVSIGLGTFALASSCGDSVPRSAAEAVPLKKGVKAPEATLTTLEGKSIKLSKALHGKRTVLVFYRGGWCPFCNAHLAELGKAEESFEKEK